MMTKSNIEFLEECPLKPGMGSITGSGVLRGIKGSKLTPSEIFLRETVQNSYDAVKLDKDKSRMPLNFTMRGFRYSDEQYQALISLLSGENRDNKFFRKYIQPNLSKDMFNIEVGDTNTLGLIGDVEPTEKIGDQNFTNFVYFTGNDKQKATDSGGSFGFGKAALYAYSKARTIAIYTRIYDPSNTTIIYNKQEDLPGYESRFIIVANDERIEDSNSDRCWWGKIKSYTDTTRGVYASPIRGRDADQLAEAIGMTKFNPVETGTRLLVLNAGPKEMPRDMGDNLISMDELLREYMPKYIVHWYWNQIYEGTINFNILLEDKKIEIDDPCSTLPYKKFIDALNTIKSTKNPGFHKAKNYIAINQERPKVSLGYAAIAKCPPNKIRYKDYFDVFSSTDPAVAYMRGIGHIVYYERIPIGNASTIQSTCYGVFCVNRKSSTEGEEPGEIDRYFRQAENQTHDRWVHDSNVSRFNYLKTVTLAVRDLVLTNTDFFVEEVKASNISIIIQRTLGTKLMQYGKNIGGTTQIQPKAPKNSNTSPTKNTLTYADTPEIKMTREGKVVAVQYKASVKDKSRIRINSVVPKIHTNDGDFVIDEEIAAFKSVEYGGRNKNSMITQFTKLPMEIPHSLTVKMNILCKQECVFDLDIAWEEITNNDSKKTGDNK